MTKSMEVDVALEGAEPLVHQHAPELQGCGHIFGMPIALSENACKEFAMGTRNATVRKLAVPDLTTTVLTLTITGLAADSSLAGGNNPGFPRRGAAIAFMLGGAVVGAWLVAYSVALPLAVCSVLSGSCARASHLADCLVSAPRELLRAGQSSMGSGA